MKPARQAPESELDYRSRAVTIDVITTGPVYYRTLPSFTRQVGYTVATRLIPDVI